MGNGSRLHNGKGFIQQTGLTTSTITVANGQKFINTVSITLSDDTQLIMARILRTTWLGSRTGANWFPYGSGVTMANYPYALIEGPAWFYDTSGSTLAKIKQNQEQSQMVITNNSGSSQDFIMDAYVRYIVNEGGLGSLS